MTLKLIAFVAALAVAAPPAAAQHRYNEGREMMKQLGGGGLSGKKLEKAIAKAERHPLGSQANPVRENMPQGQRAYLGRLRCADGQKPAYSRSGSRGVGVYRNIIDLYMVTCAGAAPVEVYMDMYHDGPELRPIPGFTIVPPEPDAVS